MNYLLQIAMNIDTFEKLVAILIFATVVFTVVFVNGIDLKLGDRELMVGGVIKKLIAKKDMDILVKERLKKQSDEIDHDMIADILDLAEEMDNRLERALINRHCVFTLDKFIGIVKKEIHKRIRRNNLKIKLCEHHKDQYIAKILKEVKEQYQMLQIKALAADCHDKYGDFVLIEDEVSKSLADFCDQAKVIIINRLKEKISLYETARQEFKIPEIIKTACDIPIAKNQKYIGDLEVACKEQKA
jgi:hypothetical protein